MISLTNYLIIVLLREGLTSERLFILKILFGVNRIRNSGLLFGTLEEMTKTDESEYAEEVISFPPVRIAVVAHEENDWFQESVASFANLNYLDKQLTVLTTGQMEWVEPIVSQYFPDAEILEVDPEAGLGANFNAVLGNHDAPAFYLFCHHDVALAPDALRLMVEESYRSNAAVVGPKVVNWERPNEL